jgi:PAS domain S-box-containing protein
MSQERYRILMVDDDEIDRMAFLRYIRTYSLPYDCRTVASLGQARDTLATGSFDLIILDRQLPDGLGFELLPQTAGIPVIFATGSDSPEDIVRALKEGASDYLVKDAESNHLKLLPLAVERALQQHRDRLVLQETQQLFRQTFNEAPIGIAFISPRGAFLRVNPALCAIFGLPESELIARGSQLLFQASIGPECLRILSGARRTEKLSRRADGREVWLQLDLVLVPDSSGQDPTCVAQIQDITDRKQAEAEVERSHAELVEASRHAGMAEVATGVLHNVANVLTSVTLASSLLDEEAAKSKVANLPRVVAMLTEHKADIGAFLTDDPKGKLIPAYLSLLSEHLASERTEALRILARLRLSVEHLIAIVSAQQMMGKTGGSPQQVGLADFINNALLLASVSEHSDVRIVTDVDPKLTITVNKHRALQVLVNLIRNGIQACDNSGQDEKVLIVRAILAGPRVKIAVIDNGVGIDPANLPRIFSHGFTTKKEGHGFGLHSCLLVARELGGELTVHSDGPGLGAMFTLELPA